MTPDEVLCETVDKITQQLSNPQHKDITKFGEDKLDAIQKLTQILAPKLAVPRVEKIAKSMAQDPTQVNKTGIEDNQK